MKKNIAGTEIDVNEEGYLTDMSQWNEAIAAAIAAEEGIGPLTDAHNKVINYLRQQQAAGTAQAAAHPPTSADGSSAAATLRAPVASRVTRANSSAFMKPTTR